jgi:hypothetical protein
LFFPQAEQFDWNSRSRSKPKIVAKVLSSSKPWMTNLLRLCCGFVAGFVAGRPADSTVFIDNVEVAGLTNQMGAFWERQRLAGFSLTTCLRILTANLTR